jgi:steroid delta-isomerase-like uncharacterized protein
VSIEDNIRVAEEHLDAEAHHDIERLLDTLTEDCVYEDSLLEEPVRGKDAVRRYYLDLWRAFPDFEFEVTSRVADETTVVYEMVFRGHQRGDFRGLAASGRVGELKAVVVFPMRDGKATGERVYLDGLEFMTQVGALPRRDSLPGRLLLGALWLRYRAQGLLSRQPR